MLYFQYPKINQLSYITTAPCVLLIILQLFLSAFHSDSMYLSHISEQDEKESFFSTYHVLSHAVYLKIRFYSYCYCYFQTLFLNLVFWRRVRDSNSQTYYRHLISSEARYHSDNSPIFRWRKIEESNSHVLPCPGFQGQFVPMHGIFQKCLGGEIALSKHIFLYGDSRHSA